MYTISFKLFYFNISTLQLTYALSYLYQNHYNFEILYSLSKFHH